MTGGERNIYVINCIDKEGECVIMYLYIEIVDVVANAFMELLKKGGKKYVLFSELDNYGAKVVEYLNADENIHAVYVVSQEAQHGLCVDYSQFFKEYEGDNGERGVELEDGISEMDIWNHFRTALSFRVMMAFKTTSIIG